MTPAAEIMSRIEMTRKVVTAGSSREERSDVGQFLTPLGISVYMSSLFGPSNDRISILDAGAGTGILFSTLIAELISRTNPPRSIHVDAYESSKVVLPHLRESIQICRKICNDAGIEFIGNVVQEDFISGGLKKLNSGLFNDSKSGYTHAILNPPYKKINGNSDVRKQLNASGFETSNLYSAFVWLSTELLAPDGEIVAITPRSFCNGPYFKRFRKALLQSMNLNRVHVFESRKEAFADDSVLQENIIFHGIRAEKQQKYITISSSKGSDLSNSIVKKISYDRIVLPHDKDAFIHVVENEHGQEVMEWMSRLYTSLIQLGLEVSTGRVVEFRSREYIYQESGGETVPLIYPSNFKDGFIVWPSIKGRKPNAILRNDCTKDLLVTSSYYVLVKRFSSKEERRRIVSAVYDPNKLDTEYVGFENHLNFFHAMGSGVAPLLAKGLSCYLNSTVFDEYFRLFSGHTQVNATDLRKVMYPTKEQLIAIGKRIRGHMPNQNTIDSIVEETCRENG